MFHIVHNRRLSQYSRSRNVDIACTHPLHKIEELLIILTQFSLLASAKKGSQGLSSLAILPYSEVRVESILNQFPTGDYQDCSQNRAHQSLRNVFAQFAAQKDARKRTKE